MSRPKREVDGRFVTTDAKPQDAARAAPTCPRIRDLLNCASTHPGRARTVAVHDGFRLGIAGDRAACAFVEWFHRPYIHFTSAVSKPDVLVSALLLEQGAASASRAAAQSHLRSVLAASHPLQLDGGLEFHNRPAANAYVLLDRGSGLVVVASEDRTALKRQMSAVVRDQILGAVDHRAGFRLVHAACAARGDAAVAIAGPTGAGKSTFLLGLLAGGGGWNLVANDRTKIRRAPCGYEVRGVAARCSLDSRLFTRDKLLYGMDTQVTPDGTKALVNSGNVVKRLGAEIQAEARLVAVIMPVIDVRVTEVDVQAVTRPAMQRRALTDNLLDESPNNRHPDWLRFRPPRPRQQGKLRSRDAIT